VALVRSNAGTYVVRLKREDGDRISTGDIVFFSGSFVPFERANAPGGFDELRYWRPKGAIGAVEAESIEKEGRSAGPAAWRDFLNKKISSALPPRTAGYVMASWTGERDEFLTDLHRLDGTSHLLAVSGFHVGIVFGICWFFLRRFRSRLYPISAAIWAYVLLTGAAPSSVRAAAMIQVMIVGRLVGRSGKSFNTACVAGFIMLIVNPWLMWDIGWRLSVLAVLAITAVAQANCVKWKVFIAPPLVWLATSMQAAWTFGDVPIAGLVTNLIALPAFGVLFPLAWILSLPALIGLPFGDLPARFAEFLFARWETLSGNIIFLLPQQISFSASLVISGSFALTYFFALASGFSGNRAMLAAVIHLAGLLWVSW
jgi:competence protein ComEC